MQTRFDLTGLSPRNRRAFALGIRGGDGDDTLDVDALLTQVDGMAELNDDDLTKLDADLTAAGLGLLDDPTDDHLKAAGRVKEAIDKVRAETSTRETAAAERLVEAAELAKAIKGESGDDGESDDKADDADDDKSDDDKADDADASDDADGGDDKAGDADDAAAGDSDAGDADADAEAEKIAAAASKPRIGRVAARRPAVGKPMLRGGGNEHASMVLRASANVPGVTAGAVLDNPVKVFEAFRAMSEASEGYQGPRVKLPVMQLGAYDVRDIYGEERTLDDSARNNSRKIHALTSLDALRASGGQCAPPPVDYTQPVLGETLRPLWNALARMGADRGGVTVMPMPTLEDVEDSFGVWTLANDATPGSDGGTDFTGDPDGDGPDVKSCLEITCADSEEAFVDALTSCLTVGNFRKMYWGESVDAWVKKAAVLFARKAETRLLQKMLTSMTHTTQTGVLGTTRAVLAALDQAGAGIRYRQRLDPDYPLHLVAPSWLLDSMITDLSREQPGSTAERLATTDAQIEAWLASRQFNVTWMLDALPGQGFAAQTSGALNPFPESVDLGIFVEGQEIGLDGGKLDFGIVRDSVLNGVNKMQMFSEGMEGYLFHGEEHIRLTLGICPNGTTSGPDDAMLDLCGVS